MMRKGNILIAISTTIAIELGLWEVMSIPFAVSYLPIAILYTGAFGVLLNKRSSRSVDTKFTRCPNCVIKAIWSLVIIGVLTLICATIASILDPIIWLKIFPYNVPVLSSISLNIVASVFLTVACIILYALRIHIEKNRPSNRRGNKVLSWVIQYLQNETMVGRGKSNEYLIELLSFEVKMGSLHLWGRKNNKDIFIRPKDFKGKHYFFELYNKQYRICSLIDESVIWGPAFIECEVTDRWPSEQITNS